MRFYTYGRKSVYKDNSDSIDNQFRMCREYCELKFPNEIDSWDCFSDEDFTGANTDRPGFQHMMSLIREDLCDVLVVYQLDRFSRDVRDFSAAYSELQAHHVRFICLDLNIDTSTPIGEAMMYVSAAFGQMERKNIALRVADNMIGLARKGYWVGGNPPMGYTKRRVDVEGRRHVSLAVDPEGADRVMSLFDYFLSSGLSLQGLETDFRKRGVKAERGGFFSSTQLHQLLTSPYCCEATQDVYDFFAAKGCKMESPRELWDGSVGVMVYGRSTQKNDVHQKTKPEDWIVCLGLHKPFMPAEKWLAVQGRLNRNKNFHAKKYPTALLRGVLRCSCGALMAVSSKKRLHDVGHWYYCERRMRMGAEVCPRIQIKCELLDNKVIEVLKSIEADPKQIEKFVAASSKRPAADPKKIQTKINAIEGKIGRLASSLSLADNSPAARYIIAEMEKLDAEKRTLQAAKQAADSERRGDMRRERENAQKVKEIAQLLKEIDGFTADERNEIIRSVVKECTWDGETLSLLL
jgi:DNA invertase Pin-like site-specific DNA recombinase